MRIDELKRRIAENGLDEGMPAELCGRIARAKARARHARVLARGSVYLTFANLVVCLVWAAACWNDLARREWLAWWLVAFSLGVMLLRAHADRSYLAAYFEACQYEDSWRTERILAILQEPA